MRVLDNFSTGNRANLEGLDVEVVEGELRCYERVHAAVRGDRGRLPPRRARLRAALGAGSAHVERRQRRGHAQRAARRARRRRAARDLLVLDVRLRHRAVSCRPSETTPPDPISPYGVAKLAAERYCISFSRVYESFETVVLRYFNVFGPRQSPHSQYAAVVPLFIAAIDRGEPVTIYGDGEQSRDFTYVGERRRRDDPRGRGDAGASGRIVQRRRGLAREREPRRGDDRRHPRQAGREALRAAAARGHPRLLGRHLRRRARLLGYEPRVDLAAGLRAHGRGHRCRESDQRVKILRVIARLNMGGPALHVAYLTEGSTKRGYETTLVAGSLARGEDSMAFVADAPRRRDRARSTSSGARSRRCATCWRRSGWRG